MWPLWPLVIINHSTIKNMSIVLKVYYHDYLLCLLISIFQVFFSWKLLMQNIKLKITLCLFFLNIEVNCTVLQLYSITIIQYYNYTVLQLYSITIIQYYNYTALYWEVIFVQYYNYTALYWEVIFVQYYNYTALYWEVIFVQYYNYTALYWEVIFGQMKKLSFKM